MMVRMIIVDEDVGGNDIYKESMESMLILLSDLYSEEEISVGASGPSFCSTLHCLLTTSTTALKNSIQFCPKKDILL